MKVMVMVKASPSSEAGAPPTEELLTAMMAFNEELVKAGIMESGDGLKPTSEGYRVHFDGAERIVSKGPFMETNELLAGYWIWNVSSMEEALEWVKKCPNPMYEPSDIEIRSFYGMEDFAEADPCGTVAEQESALRDKVILQKASLTTYLCLCGRAEEALQFYQQHLGATIGTLFRFRDSPEPIPAEYLPPNFDDKIMHGEFTLGDTTFFITDGTAPNGPTGFNGFSLNIRLYDEPVLRKAFDALAEEGNIIMPLSPTFWSPLYGQVVDKFGITWMLMIPGEEA